MTETCNWSESHLLETVRKVRKGKKKYIFGGDVRRTHRDNVYSISAKILRNIFCISSRKNVDTYDLIVRRCRAMRISRLLFRHKFCRMRYKLPRR